ncbi:DUF6144 family protein [candidate division KSB1 bacterium]
MNNTQKWIVNLVKNLDDAIDEEAKKRVLEDVGRGCIPNGFIDQVKIRIEDFDDPESFIDSMCSNWDKISREGEYIYITYPECSCPVVKESPEKLSPTFCNCCRGWVMELFETVIKKPVDVAIESTILGGADSCRIRISI